MLLWNKIFEDSDVRKLLRSLLDHVFKTAWDFSSGKKNLGETELLQWDGYEEKYKMSVGRGWELVSVIWRRMKTAGDNAVEIVI